MTRARHRLARARTDDGPPLDDLLERVVGDFSDGSAEDDIALLAFRWRRGEDAGVPAGDGSGA